MLRTQTILWIVLTIVILAFPIGYLVYFFGDRFWKSLKILVQKVVEIKTLDKMRKDILQKRVQENLVEDKVWWDTPNELEPVDSLKKNLVKQDIKEEVTEDKEEGEVINKQLQLKQKKLLEKIIYEAQVLKKDWKLDQYEKKLIEWLAIDSGNVEINKYLADLYFTVGNNKKALSLLKKIIEADPKDHNAIWQIGEIYLITWDFETAELLVEKAIGLQPSNPKYYISLVEILYNTGRKNEAIEVMEKIVKLRPVNSWYMLTLADLYEEIDDYDNAKKYYFRVLEIEPSNEKAKRKIKNYS